MTKVNQSRIREALTAGTNVKEKGPPVADGILSVTPDTPEMLEWRSRSALDVAETSSTFLDDEDDGPKPHELYGKFTWKIENFSEISKRELRSNVFDVGSYKWYILVYPQGCDVCNHLSLFLCVADYDKLLPGWSHFAQFTIAVVNKDPKKSKYSDTLHRFCKKEHDWGWKKFMELSKVLDGFTVADTLVIKAQVQVILDKPSKPFRCLDPQYRRELVRVYLTNVEGICRRFCEDKKARLGWAREEAASFWHFWGSLSPEQQRKYLTDKGEAILKAVVKQFFNEKEVTSTLVMDALYSGCKQIEEHSRAWLEGKCSGDNAPVVLIKAERNTFTLCCGDIMEIVERVQKDYIPAAKDDNKALPPNDGLTLRSGQDGDDYRRDSIERDEKRLAELGRKTIEMFVIAHIFCEKLEVAYREAEALKRQDQLIAEEFEMARLEESKAQAKAQADKEKKAKKKEKLKLKREAEKLRREAEEAERRAREDEARRQEVERKAKEAEKRRLEEAQAQQQPSTQQQQQPQGRKQAPKPREDKRALLQAPSQQQQTLQVKQALSASTSQQQQLPAGPTTQPSTHAANERCAAVAGSSLPSLSSLAAAAVAESAADAAACQAERPDRRDEPSSESGSDEEVGTVNQATGAAESSGSGEDDVEAGAGSSSAAGGAAAALSESDGASDSESRAALEEEVTILRAQVMQLQKQLAERDAELFALRAQLAELQPTEIADTVKAGAAAAAAGGSGAPARASSSCCSGAATCSTSSSTPVEGAAEAAAAAPAASGSVGREAGAAESSSGSGRPETSRSVEKDRTAKAEPATPNGVKDSHQQPQPHSSPTSTAAAIAAAAVRRIQALAATSASASGHDPAGPLSHPGVIPARSASSGPAVSARPMPPVAASGQPRSAGLHAGGGEAIAPHHPQAAAAAATSASTQQPQPAGTASAATPSGESHLAAAPPAGVMMQRSTSATLPGVAGGSSTTAPVPYTPLAQHQLAAAAANGRPRQLDPASSGATTNSASTSSATTASSTSSKPVPYMPPSSGAAGTTAPTVAPSANGILHSSTAQEGLSYRNAAAGVLASAGPAGSGSHSLASSAPAAAAGSMAAVAPILAPANPGAPAGQTSGGAHKRVDEGQAAAAARHMGHSVATSAAEGAFNASSARIMMQQAQRTSLGFGTPPAVSSAAKRMAASNQLDSPGLEDFAHINMIDDLLTE
ncbi:hypothetical protein Agub_g7962 [Astrephomene gubernaculifera]|uniref:MATH domain-containing protein n=1 Tax=Astrephomene gubernaculifera TaxID=47775 RepID=A0AAD3DQV2_9CHLO|nr:hypothetical protein Agub_g7962 [Astrephomene gubernaculifera]